MSAWDMQLIAAIIKEKGLQRAANRGIRADVLASAEGQLLYESLEDYASRPEHFGEVASLEMLESFHPGVSETLPKPSQSLDAIIEKVLNERLTRDIDKLLEEVNKLRLNNPKKAAALLAESSARLYESRKSEDEDITKDIGRAIRQDYDKILKGGGVGLWPWPWEPMTRTLGMVEPGTLNVIWGPPKRGKCVVKGERVAQRDGRLVAIEDLPEHCEAPSYTESTGKIRWAAAERVYSGVKDCVEVTLESGLCLRTSTEHLYMVPSGYERICNLGPGSYVAIARTYPEFDITPFDERDAYLLGLLMGDGNYTRGEMQFTSADPEVVEALRAEVARFGAVLSQGSRPIEYRVVGGERCNNRVLTWLRDLGVHGKKAPEKTVPVQILQAQPSAQWAFLAGLYDTDGGLDLPSLAYWSSASKELMQGVQHLLFRLGVTSVLTERDTNAGTTAWLTKVTAQKEIQPLWRGLSPYTVQRFRKERMQAAATRKIQQKRNKDTIPRTQALVELMQEERAKKLPVRINGKKVSPSNLFRRTKRISRALLQALAGRLDSERLQVIANQELIWDKIVSITSIGRMDCYDICIRDGQDPNFVVEGLIVHNTWLAIKMVVDAFLNYSKRVLVYSPEMRKEQLQRRAAVVLAGISYDEYRKGLLTEEKVKVLFEMLDWIEAATTSNMTHERIIILNRDNVRGAKQMCAQMQAKIDVYKPDLLFVDSAYRDADSAKWTDITAISRGVKDIGNRTGVPIIAVTQENIKQNAALKGMKRRGDESVSHSQGWVEDMDLGIRVSNDNDGYIRMQWAGSREAKLSHGGIRCLFDPGCTFDFYDYKYEDPEPEPVAQQGGGGYKSSLPLKKILNQKRQEY